MNSVKVVNPAPLHSRYVGKFYYDFYKGRWVKVIQIFENDQKWRLVEVNAQGTPIGMPFVTRESLEACYFADHPFPNAYLYKRTSIKPMTAQDVNA